METCRWRVVFRSIAGNDKYIMISSWDYNNGNHGFKTRKEARIEAIKAQKEHNRMPSGSTRKYGVIDSTKFDMTKVQ